MRILILLAIIGASVHFWNVQKEKNALSTATVSTNGFMELPAFTGLDTTSVVIFAAENCPHEAAQRADNLAAELSRMNIPNIRSHSANFEFANNPDPALLTRLNSVMQGELPAVFVNGKGKANPSLDEVISEYSAAHK